jgi:hypothetical protein
MLLDWYKYIASQNHSGPSFSTMHFLPFLPLVPVASVPYRAAVAATPLPDQVRLFFYWPISSLIKFVVVCFHLRCPLISSVVAVACSVLFLLTYCLPLFFCDDCFLLLLAQYWP